MCICLFGMWSRPSHEVDKRTISGTSFFVKNIALFLCDILIYLWYRHREARSDPEKQRGIPYNTRIASFVAMTET